MDHFFKNLWLAIYSYFNGGLKNVMLVKSSTECSF